MAGDYICLHAAQGMVVDYNIQRKLGKCIEDSYIHIHSTPGQSGEPLASARITGSDLHRGILTCKGLHPKKLGEVISRVPGQLVVTHLLESVSAVLFLTYLTCLGAVSHAVGPIYVHPRCRHMQSYE